MPRYDPNDHIHFGSNLIVRLAQTGNAALMSHSEALVRRPSRSLTSMYAA